MRESVRGNHNYKGNGSVVVTKEIEEVLSSLLDELRKSIPKEDRACFNAFDICLVSAISHEDQEAYNICNDIKSSFECLLTNDCILTAAIKQEIAKNNRDDLKTLGCPFNVKDLVLSSGNLDQPTKPAISEESSGNVDQPTKPSIWEESSVNVDQPTKPTISEESSGKVVQPTKPAISEKRSGAVSHTVPHYSSIVAASFITLFIFKAAMFI
ncbi:uncharacterized protein LOC106064316 [Biomphalaria glabrata]|uniref:Uncharacterized protein LOC106064316 n=1 Tax=Biomphalaria glabrata TaxID=6526 RepID=A0A9W3A6G8_BIOGL|nr:uncharacterized protein LOC106064316 [Biomphalaria glabrata]